MQARIFFMFALDQMTGSCKILKQILMLLTMTSRPHKIKVIFDESLLKDTEILDRLLSMKNSNGQTGIIIFVIIFPHHHHYHC